MQRCKKCVLPNTIINIDLDKNGVCSHCQKDIREVDRYNFDGKDVEFNKLIEQKKKRRIDLNLKYDVLVSISGGRDSAYVVYKLVKDYNLNVLCVHYENPFNSMQAKNNIYKITDSLGIDLVVLQDKGSIHKKSFKNNLKAWIRDPELGTVGLLCLACQSMPLGFYKVAKENNIELIVTGANPYEITSFKMDVVGVEDLDKNRVSKLIRHYSKKILRNTGYIRPVNIIPALKATVSLYGSTPYLRWKYPDIRKKSLFYHFPYNEKEIHQALDTIGWRKAPDNPSPWRFDCEVDSVKNYIYESLIGSTEKDDLFSRYIRAGLMTREDAIKRLQSEGTVNIEVVERVLNKIGVELSELDEALHKANQRA